MKTTVKINKKVELTILKVSAGVRYWEDAIVNGEQEPERETKIPFRRGDLWCPKIEIDTGIIIGWPKGTTAEIHYKVCDQFSCDVFDDEDNVVLKLQEDYVPRFMCPSENGYGDYIKMTINAEGKIEGWKFDLSAFTNDED